MIIAYCARCGLRIPDPPPDANNASELLCKNCAPQAVARVSSRRETSQVPRDTARRALSTPEENPQKAKILVAACIGGLVLIGLVAFMLRGGKHPPEQALDKTAKSNEQKIASHQEPGPATPAVAISPANPAKPQSAAKQPVSAPVVDDDERKKTPVKTAAAPATEAKRYDDQMSKMRDELGAKRLQEALDVLKKNPRALLPYYEKLQVVATSYRSTEAGATAIKLLAELKLPANMASILLHYKFDETTGTVLTDSSPNARDTKLQLEPTRVPGRYGNALSFDGVKDFVPLPDSALHMPSVSIAFWFRTNGRGCMFGYSTAAIQQPQSGYVPAIYIGTDNKLRCTLWTGKANPAVSTQDVNDGNWHHVVLCGGGDSQRWYLDGKKYGELAGALDASDLRKVHLGCNYGGGWALIDKPWYYYQGEIDDFYIFRVVLTDEEVTALYKNMPLKNERLELAPQALR